MTHVLIIGTVALDTVETPFGKVQNALGGSASYASLAASFFSKPRIISIVGEDFPDEHLAFLKSRGINIEGIQQEGKSFRWEGFYEYDMNEAKTLKTELNSLETFQAKMPDSYKDSEYVYLGNIHPEQQLEVIKHLKKPKFIAMDTMNFWIENTKEQLLEVMKEVNVMIMNDGEARQLFETSNLIKAANDILKLGPQTAIIKKGEHGALMFTKDRHFSAPSFPLEDIKDPTGCGDTFGGAFTGYMAREDHIDEPTMRKAIVYGSALASHNAEDFSLNRMRALTKEDIEKRFTQLKDIREF